MISVVVPCFNEEANVGPLVNRIRDALEDLSCPWELILVDDGSRDETLREIRRARETDGRVRYLAFSRNFGHEAASTAGLEEAQGDWVVLMDADLQDPPELIPEMLERCKAGYDIVYARRTSRAGETWVKRTTARLFYWVMSRLVAFRFPRDSGDFRLMTRAPVDAFLRMSERNRFIRGMVAWTGFPSTEVAYERAPRQAGLTSYGFGKLLVLAIDAITGFSAVPLRIVSLMGLVVTCLSLFGGGIVVVQKLFFGLPIPGYAYLVAGVFFLGGIQILMLGTIGEYVGRIYVEAQRRPLYLIREAGGLRADLEHGT